MGLRGPGAAKRKAALAELADDAEETALPWENHALSRVGKVIAFLEFLPITKGILVGQRMKLLPDQVEFVENVYGPTREDGRRRVSTAIKSAPKGNGKTGLTAGLCLCHLLGPESEPRGEVYSAAIDRGQAAIMFAEMAAIIYAVPQFIARTNVINFHKKMEVLSGPGVGSTYEAMSADARKAHGLAPSLWVYDELAQAKDRTLVDNLLESMGKRREALGIILSTQARDDAHVLSQLIDYGLSGIDPSFYVQLHCAPEDADPFAEATWKACNPAWGHYLDEDDLRKSALMAQRMPSKEPAFRNLRLNQRVDASVENRAVTAAVWRQGAVPVDREKLKGRRCYGALDLSGKHDLTALVLVFPDNEPEPNYDVLPIFWTPEGAMDGRRQDEQDRFREWAKAGLLRIVPGQTIRYGWVAEELGRLRAEFDIGALAYDRWRIEDFRQDLDDAGEAARVVKLDDQKAVEACRRDGALAMVEWGQGFKDMSPAVENFVELALTARLRHGGHAVLTAAVANAILNTDPAGNQKFDKERGNGRGPVRIDGAVALASALALAKRMAAIGGETASAYEDRGILFF